MALRLLIELDSNSVEVNGCKSDVRFVSKSVCWRVENNTSADKLTSLEKSQLNNGI